MIDPNPTYSASARPRRRTPAPAPGSIPDFLDEALVPLDAELDDDIHQEVEQALDVVPGELAPSVALFHEQHQLFERQLAAFGMDAGDGTGVAGVHIGAGSRRLLPRAARRAESGPASCEDSTPGAASASRARAPDRPSSKRDGRDSGGVENEFLGVLDSDESLGGRDFRISALVQVVFP